MDVSKTLRRIDVFISSPGDVSAERQIIIQTIARLNKLPQVAKQCVVRALAYEDFVPSSVGSSAQDVVDRYMMQASKSDVFVCVMWHRMGTPVRNETSGELFQSGTEYEFMDAYRNHQQNGKPHILLYRSRKPIPSEAVAEQVSAVEAFFKQFEGGHLAEIPGLYKTYRDNEDFADTVFSDLNTVIDELLRKETPPEDQPVMWQDLCKRGRAFTERMLGQRYRKKYDPKCHTSRPQVLAHYHKFRSSDKVVTAILGKSGTGKSSLVCEIANLETPDTITWLQDCAVLELDGSTSIDQHISRSLELSGSALATFEALVAEDPSRQIILLFDAVNEFKDREYLLTRLAEFGRSINTPAVKLVVTCRLPAWNTLSNYFSVSIEREYHSAGPNSYITITAFGADEVLEVYENYRREYQIVTPYSDLTEQVKKFISQPLFLKLTVVAYKEKAIPRKLVLHEVFEGYLKQYLGEKGTETPEFVVLRRAIELMYDHAQRELQLAIISQDALVSQYVSPDTITPYMRLIDTGLLSQREIDEGLLRKMELVFVTYERVFEYLMADIKCGDSSVERIVELLDMARDKTFAQLRGAVELAFSFNILRKWSLNRVVDSDSLIEIARLDRPDSRQFLSDMIQTVYESGEHELAERLLDDLSSDEENLSSRQLALHAAYQLRLDDNLVRLAMSEEAVVRDAAVLYIYQIWNRARLEGRLDEGYALVQKIVAGIKLRMTNPQKSLFALRALMSLTINMLVHIIDDPNALLPLFHIYQNMVRSVPGLEPRTDRGLLGRFVADSVTPLIIKAVSQVLALVLKETVLSDEKFVADYFNNPKTKRALMDVGALLDLDNLVGNEEKLIRLATWPHPLVHFSNIGTMIHFLYHQPDIHLPLLQELFYGTYEYRFRVKFDILNSITYAAVCRLRAGKPIADDYVTVIEDNFMELWEIAHEVDEETGKTWIELDKEGSKKFLEQEGVVSVRRALQQGVLTGLFHIEAAQQQVTGNRLSGSEFLRRFMTDPNNPMSPLDIEVLLEALEKLAYQGKADFAVLTILDRKIRARWEAKAPDVGVRILANIRSFYQETVDNLLLMDEENKPLWDQVRLVGGVANVADVFFNNANLWMISSSVEWTVLKVLGVAAFEFAFSASIADLMTRLTRICIAALFDYDIINIGYIEWHLAHNPGWDHYEKWNIPRGLNEIKPHIHEYYRSGIADFIKLHGRGIMYDEL